MVLFYMVNVIKTGFKITNDFLHCVNHLKKRNKFMSDCCSAPGLMPYETAKSLMLEQLNVIKETETIPIEQSLGRIIAEPVASVIDVPGHNNSAMDGYAFSFDSVKSGEPMKVVGKSFAGQPFDGVCQQGECIRIMTGAKLPACCDTVQMQELVERSGDVIVLTKQPKEHANVRYRGEDIKSGAAIFDVGHQIGAIDIGLLASVGVANVKVKRQLKVAVLSTGDELKLPTQTLGDGDIYDSNRFFIKTLLEKLHCEVIDLGVIPDEKAKIEAAFKQANEQADLVISSGGVSVGEADYTKEILAKLGDIGFWKIAIKPGKPFAFGSLSDSYFFGLPGNPVSAAVTLHKLGVPGIHQLQGKTATESPRLSAVCKTALKKQPGRMDFQRGVYSVLSDGSIEVVSTGAQGSGILSSIAHANCYIVLSQEQGSVAAGESVLIEPFDGLFS